MRRARLALHGIVLLLAAGALWLPLPPQFVERYYADWLYPAIQSRLTSWSNTSDVALFDPLVIVLGGAALIAWTVCIRRAWRERSLHVVGAGMLRTATFAAVLYLWFSTAWGFNYSREPLETVIGYDSTRVTPAALRGLAERAVAETNRAYGDAHRAGFPSVGDVPPALVTALHRVERRLGRPRGTVPGRPKKTLLAGFFRSSGVDGMHAPFLLETLLNPDLTPPERPAVLAHEWGHMAGYAPESDASFVGLLAALGADPGSQYSAWLSIFEDAVSQLPRDGRNHLLAQLEPGPQADRKAIAKRLQARVEVIARASWDTYDQYLKAQGVREGVHSYSRVVQLLLGSGALDWS